MKLIDKLKDIKYKECIINAKEIANKTDKNTISILFDMAKCNIQNGCNNNEYKELGFYRLTKEERSTFLTNKYNKELINKYSSNTDKIIFADKGLLYKKFNMYLGRKYIDLRDVQYKSFSEFISTRNKIVARSSNQDSYEVIDIDQDKIKNEYNVLKIYNSIMKKDEVIVESYFEENYITRFSSELSTLKVITFLDKNENVHILNKVIVVNKNEKEKMYGFVNDEGYIISPLTDNKGHIYIEHPKTFKPISGVKLPNFDYVKPMVERLAKEVPSIKYIEWTLAFRKDDLVLINASSKPNIYEVKPNMFKEKKGLLETYKKYIK